MTTTTIPQHSPEATADRPTTGISWRGVISSEWIKLRTLRSTWAILALAIAGMLVLALVIAYNTRVITSGLDPEDVTGSGTLQGYLLGQLLLGALGILFVTGEYGTGMISSSFVAVPRRLPVVGAKLLVLAGVTLPIMVATSLGAFAAGHALLSSYRVAPALGDPGVLRAVAGTGVYLGLTAVLGAALGWIIRSTAGALVTMALFIWILPLIMSTLLGTTGKQLAKLLPSEAAGSVLTSVRLPDTLSPTAGAVVFVGWLVAFSVIAVVLVRRRDV